MEVFLCLKGHPYEINSPKLNIISIYNIAKNIKLNKTYIANICLVFITIFVSLGLFLIKKCKSQNKNAKKERGRGKKNIISPSMYELLKKTANILIGHKKAVYAPARILTASHSRTRRVHNIANIKHTNQ